MRTSTWCFASDLDHKLISGVFWSSVGKPWNAIRNKSDPLCLMVDPRICTVVPSPPFGVAFEVEFNKIKGKFVVELVSSLESLLN